VLPMAGKGSRFTNNSRVSKTLTGVYDLPKPLLPIYKSDYKTTEPMVIAAVNCLPVVKKTLYICLQEHLEDHKDLEKILTDRSDSKIVCIKDVTEGQACTCEIGIKESGISEDIPICISACDNGVGYDHEAYENLISDDSVDLIVWTFKNHKTSKMNPNMYSWVKTDEYNNVIEASVKNCKYDAPDKGQAIIGTMFFRKSKYFMEGLQRLYENNTRTNGEFYVDSVINECISKGLKVKSFCVDHYICWGTPDDYDTYRYWESYFGDVINSRN